MANSLIQQAQQFKIMVEQVKQQSMAYKEGAVTQVRNQMEKVSVKYTILEWWMQKGSICFFVQ